MTDAPDLPWAEGAWESVDVGEGWYSLISRLDQAIREISPGYRVIQVKEKFGGLRYYYTFTGGDYLEAHDRVDALVSAAEAEAMRTCETCGQPGILRTGGWYRVHCDEHEAAYQARKEEL